MGRRRETSFIFQVTVNCEDFSYIWVFTAFPLPGRSCSVLFSLKPGEVEEHVEVSRHKFVSAFIQGRLCHGGEFSTAVERTCMCKKAALPAACMTFHTSLRGSGRAQESNLELSAVRKGNFFYANHRTAVLPARVRELQWSSRSLQVSKSKSLSFERWVPSLGVCIWLLWDCRSSNKL